MLEAHPTIENAKSKHRNLDDFKYITIASGNKIEACKLRLLTYYDDDKNLVTTTEYNGHAAILNTGGCYHNVDFKEGDSERIVFQLCFEESLDEVWNLWNTQKYRCF